MTTSGGAFKRLVNLWTYEHTCCMSDCFYLNDCHVACWSSVVLPEESGMQAATADIGVGSTATEARSNRAARSAACSQTLVMVSAYLPRACWCMWYHASLQCYSHLGTGNTGSPVEMCEWLGSFHIRL
jgi:hypothetical protein